MQQLGGRIGLMWRQRDATRRTDGGGWVRRTGQKQLEKIRNDALRKKKQLKKIRISSFLGIA